MEEPGTLLRDARMGAGLSMRALAEAAGVSYTTVCRIEHGQIDPTMGTLRKLFAGMGHDVELALHTRPDVPKISDLADAWSTDAAGEEHPDWTRLRGFVDRLTRRPGLVAAAIRRKPPASGSALLDNLLAGIAEKTADDRRMPRPSWTADVPVLAEPTAGLATPRMRESYAATTPSQLAARNVMIPARALWRQQIREAA